MARGIHSTIDTLYLNLRRRWCPKWYEAFQDRNIGGFYERLGHSFRPVFSGQRRLLTQCRQLSIYSSLDYKDLTQHFDYIIEKYRQPNGLWIFSLNDDGNPLDKTCDLYALSFVIFMCTHYYRATGDDRAHNVALETLHLIDTHFRVKDLPGFTEALGENGKPMATIRRQNPHMHLLEACLFAYETWGDESFLSIADDIVQLFYKYFFNADKVILHEFFDDHLNPHPEKGDLVEPGHYFEWVWLLKKHAHTKYNVALHDKAATALFAWADAHGWDKTYGGVYDVLKPDGTVVADTKRLWPFCEALKAYALMLNITQNRQSLKDRVADMVTVFLEKYMQDRGFWTELLNRDLTTQTDYMPGTTPYHVYFGVLETKNYLDARGFSKSLSFRTRSLWFTGRRAVSNTIKACKKKISGKAQI